MTPQEIIEGLKRLNAWREGDESIDDPSPEWIGRLLDEAAELLKKSCSRRTRKEDLQLLPCGCGGKVGSRAAVKFHPLLNIIDGVTRYEVRCARCKKVATTENGGGFEIWQAALKKWNRIAHL